MLHHALKMMFYNIKKICVKQITQIFFKLLLITGGLLIVFGLRGSQLLPFRCQMLNYLATDGYYIQNRNHQEESKT